MNHPPRLRGGNAPLFTKRQLAMLLWPLMVEHALAIAVGMVDSIMVSSAGEAAMSGVSLVDMINVLLLEAFAALAAGGAVVTSQLIGAKRPAEARASADQIVFVVALASLVVTGAVLACRRQLLQLVFGSVAPEVMQFCLRYLTITAISYPFVALHYAASAMFRSMGRTRVCMVVGLCMNLLNVAGNAILIYGFGMGVTGAAISTLASRIAAAVLMVALLRRKKGIVFLGPIRQFRPNRALIGRIVHIGIPGALENSMFHLGRILVFSSVAGFATAQIAANAIAGNMMGLSVIGAEAIAQGAVTVVGQSVGAGQWQQLRRYAFLLTAAAMVTNLVSCGVLAALMPAILQLYHAAPQTIDYVRILTAWSLGGVATVWAAAFVIPAVLRACNDAVFTSAASILSMWIFRVGFGSLLGVQLGLGVQGVWIGMVADWCFRALVFIPRFLRTDRKRRRAFAQEARLHELSDCDMVCKR